MQAHDARVARWISVSFAAALAVSVCADEVTVKNDSFETGGSANVQAGFVAGESAAAWLTSPCNGNIVALQVAWLSQNGLTEPSIEDSIRVFKGGTFPNPGAEVLLLEAPLMTDGAINEFRFVDEGNTIPINIPVTAGEVFVVSFRFATTPSPFNGPSVITDVGTGCQNGKNAIFAVPPSIWFNGCSLGITGDFVIRAVVDCGAASGACCKPDGTCDELTAAECSAAGGVYQGNNSTCGQVTCPQPSGACCIDGVCLPLTEGDCLIAEGDWLGAGTQCGPAFQCPTGACCLPDGSCMNDVTSADCALSGGTFQGVGSTCGSVSCPQPSGACCLANGNCLLLPQGSCDALSGASWAGPGTTCTDGNGNGSADACEASACAGDVDQNGFVEQLDLNLMLATWSLCQGQTGYNGAADFDDSNCIDQLDLNLLLANFGTACP